MKKTQALILLTSLAASSVVFAATGAAPRCTSGALNLVVVNKDVGGCPGAAAGHYCMYDLFMSGQGQIICEDDDDGYDTVYEHTNESYSFKDKQKKAGITHYLGSDINGRIKNQELHFTYENGSASDNCDQVFGPDVQCVITKSGDSKHPTYTLTVSKTS